MKLTILICVTFDFDVSRAALAPGLFVTSLRVGGLDKMSPEQQGGFYLLVLGADNS